MPQNEDTIETDNQAKITESRRTILKAAMASAVGGSALTLKSSQLAAAATSGDVLFKTDFENYNVGTYPDGWTQSGNSDQKVVNTTAGSGSKSFRMSGNAGGCWEAISHHPVQIPDSGIVQIKGQINPTSDGAVGCHDNRGSFFLRTKVSKEWYPGSAVRLFTFGKNGTIIGMRDTDLGSYNPDKWYDFTVEYVRSDGRVTQTYWFDGEKRGEIPRDVTEFEDDLSAISLQSGDFTVFWDALSLVHRPLSIEVQIDIKPGSDPNAINPNGKGVIPVAILHTEDFDPTQRVKVSTLRFGAPEVVDNGDGASPAKGGHVEDVDDDGDDDLVLHFPTQDTGFDSDDEEGKLVGETKDGTPLFGTDSVKIIQ